MMTGNRGIANASATSRNGASMISAQIITQDPLKPETSKRAWASSQKVNGPWVGELYGSIARNGPGSDVCTTSTVQTNVGGVK